MLDGNIFAVYTKENEIIGLYAMAEKIPMNYNLVRYIENCNTFNICKTWKEAQKIARQWNSDFLNNGRQRIRG